MKTKVKSGQWTIIGFACIALVCVIAGCAEGPTPSSTPRAEGSADNTPAPPSTGGGSPGEQSVKPRRDVRPDELNPEAESNPCRATALVLEQLLEKSTRDFAQQTCDATRTK